MLETENIEIIPLRCIRQGWEGTSNDMKKGRIGGA